MFLLNGLYRGCTVVQLSVQNKEAAHTQSAKVSTCYTLALWGLVINYREGGIQNGKGGQVKFYHLQKGEGWKKSFSHAEVGGGGHSKF